MTDEKKPPNDSNTFVLALTAMLMVVIVVLALLSFMKGQHTEENRNGFQGASPITEASSDDEGSVSQRIRTLRSILGAIVG
jgi:flagellar basal body-associated protein FliL